VFAQEKTAYTLDHCVKRALENNGNIRSAEFEVGSAQHKVLSVKTERLPSVEFSGSYTRSSAIEPFSITMPTGQRLDIFPSIEDNYGLNLTVKQPVFTGKRISSNIEIAQNIFNAKENSLAEVKNNIRFAVKNYFWKLAQAIESENVVNESIEMVKTHLKDVINLRENGMASENDVKRVEVQLSNMELLKASIEKGINLNRSVLCKLMNIPLNSQFDLDYDLLFPEFNYDFNAVLNSAFKDRPLLNSMRSMLRSAEAGKEMVRSSFFPSVYLLGNYNYAKPNRNIFPIKDRWKDTWNAGVMVQFTLWKWGKRKMDYEAADNDYKKLQSDLENLQSDIELDIKRIFLEIDESVKRYKVSNKMVEQAEENYRISKDKYSSGLLLNSELLDAEVDLLKSKLEVTKSIMDFNINLAELKKAAGINE
jgi:outer membrane protein TolC